MQFIKDYFASRRYRKELSDKLSDAILYKVTMYPEGVEHRYRDSLSIRGSKDSNYVTATKVGWPVYSRSGWYIRRNCDSLAVRASPKLHKKLDEILRQRRMEASQELLKNECESIAHTLRVGLKTDTNIKE